MDKLLEALFGYFNWLFSFLESFGVKVPDYVKDNFTTTEAETTTAAQ